LSALVRIGEDTGGLESAYSQPLERVPIDPRIVNFALQLDDVRAHRRVV
jgi:hypothetical protein